MKYFLLIVFIIFLLGYLFIKYLVPYFINRYIKKIFNIKDDIQNNNNDKQNKNENKKQPKENYIDISNLEYTDYEEI